MPEIRVKIASPVGLHARPAARFVKAAAKYADPVSIGRPDADPVDARSMLSVLGLGILHGEEVVITGGQDALDELSTLLSEAE
jgi:phosphocarrier protein